MEKVDTVSILPAQMQEVFLNILLAKAVPEAKAKKCAEVFAMNSADGVITHGVNRFPRFVSYIERGIVKPGSDPECVSSIGALEQWDGQSGIGITNAFASTERAMALASDHGLGCVALRRTNHWMRAGTYARHAADHGFAFIAWSNTIHNTPAWGGLDPRLGNNPLTIALPFEDAPVVLDIAMSQFSYGALDRFRMEGKPLPVAGGYDESGKLSTDAEAILKTRRTLPIGYWKGSGLSLLLDMLAAVLSSGLSVSEISKRNDETDVSQIFLAFDLKKLPDQSGVSTILKRIIDDVKESQPVDPGTNVRYPGERTDDTRKKSFANGIRVNASLWDEVLALQSHQA